MLHISCLNNQPKMVHELFNYFNSTKEITENIKEWVNQETDEGFCAIHFASFKGNIVNLFISISS